MVLGILWAVGYAGSYVYLSRRGMAELPFPGAFWFYVPLEEVGPDSPGLERHYRLVAFYKPLGTLDRMWFGGRSPCTGITWGLSARPRTWTLANAVGCRVSSAFPRSVAQEVVQLFHRVDLPNRRLDIVGDAPKTDACPIEQHVARPPIAVARLPDGSHIANDLATTP
jgi:hypothetical protein